MFNQLQPLEYCYEKSRKIRRQNEKYCRLQSAAYEPNGCCGSEPGAACSGGGKSSCLPYLYQHFAVGQTNFQLSHVRETQFSWSENVAFTEFLAHNDEAIAGVIRRFFLLFHNTKQKCGQRIRIPLAEVPRAVVNRRLHLRCIHSQYGISRNMAPHIPKAGQT